MQRCRFIDASLKMASADNCYVLKVCHVASAIHIISPYVLSVSNQLV
jgi:hypothetical protein